MSDSLTGAGVDPRPAGDRWPQVNAYTCQAVTHFFEIFFLLALHFLRKWSTLADWL
jgi:hypothetical protein